MAKAKWQRANANVEKQDEMDVDGLKATDGATTTKRAREVEKDNEHDGDDWDELAREERMVKKVKKGEISQKQFDAEFGDL